jgi:hypothetical protein
MKKYYILFLLISFLQACTSDDFTLESWKDNKVEIDGYMISGYGTVKEKDNSVMLYEDAYISLRRKGYTELGSDITVEIKEGEGVQFAMRCVSNKSENHPAILFTYSTGGSTIQEKGKSPINISQYKAKINEPVRIVFLNDCKRFDILLDCDTVYTGWTDIPNTDYLLVKALPKSKVQLTGISMVEKGEDENKVEEVIYK